jgi:hypothetical protein
MCTDNPVPQAFDPPLCQFQLLGEGQQLGRTGGEFGCPGRAIPQELIRLALEPNDLPGRSGHGCEWFGDGDEGKRGG